MNIVLLLLYRAWTVVVRNLRAMVNARPRSGFPAEVRSHFPQVSVDTPQSWLHTLSCALNDLTAN